MGYVLINPIRRLGQRPERILAGLVQPGMSVLDVGCAMGFFTLPMAQMVGREGHVVAVDLQPRMLSGLERRARKRGLVATIETRICGSDDLGIGDLAGQVDFTLAFAMVHEVPDAGALFEQLHLVLRPGASLLVAEPKGHVSRDAFDESLGSAAAAGFTVVDEPRIARSHGALLQART